MNPHGGRAASFVTASDLGFEEGPSVVFWGISGDGRTVLGRRSRRPTGSEDYPHQEAFRWNADRGIVGIGSLPEGTVASQAVASSFDGSMVVGFLDRMISAPDPASGPVTSLSNAFVWGDQTGVRPLDPETPRPTHPRSSWASGISADGTTIVGSRHVRSELVGEDEPVEHWFFEAIVWREGREPLLLGTFETEQGSHFHGLHGSFATDVSADGTIVIGGSNTPLGEQGFVWDEVRGMRRLGRLSPEAPGHSDAIAISADGSTIVGRDVVVGDDLQTLSMEGFVFNEAAGMQRLTGDLDRWSDTVLTDVSADGSIAVGIGYGTTAGNLAGEAFVWDARHGVRLLEDLLAELGVPTHGWSPTDALGISDDGRTIVGMARGPGDRPSPFIAVIPEPGTAILIAFGVTTLAIRRASRS